MWEEFVSNKQTKNQLARRSHIHKKKITKLLDDFNLLEKIHNPRSVTVIFDASYFGRQYGILVARDPNKKENLHVHEIVSETKQEYQTARIDLERRGYVLHAVVLDGKRGIPSVFKDIPVQICQFHQWQIVKRKLTTKPKLPSHQALLSIARQISQVTEPQMKKFLETFEKLFHADLNEKTYVIGLNRPRFTHAKLRSAYRSLVTNLPHLYVYQKYPELKIPNTTNSLDGSFNALKSHVNIHRGLRKDRRFKSIRYYLKL